MWIPWKLEGILKRIPQERFWKSYPKRRFGVVVRQSDVKSKIPGVIENKSILSRIVLDCVKLPRALHRRSTRHFSTQHFLNTISSHFHNSCRAKRVTHLVRTLRAGLQLTKSSTKNFKNEKQSAAAWERWWNNCELGHARLGNAQNSNSSTREFRHETAPGQQTERVRLIHRSISDSRIETGLEHR